MNHMKIGIDCRMAGRGEGIGRYIEELAHNLSLIDNKNEYFLICRVIPPENQKSKIKNQNFKFVTSGSGYYSLAEQTRFIWELKRLKLDLVHFANFNFPILYPGKFVTTIHDTIHHFYPGKKMSRVFHRAAYRAVFWAAVKRASKIISVSDQTKKDIVGRYKIDPDRVAVIQEGVDPKFSHPLPRDAIEGLKVKYGIAKPYILFVGVWRQYKNLPRLARSFDILKDSYGRDYQLVIVGKIDPFYPEIKREVLTTVHSGDIRAPGFVPEGDLLGLYQGAKIFVLPSLVEGFGLIGLEAQAAGVPVVASGLPVLREILGDGAVFFDPGSAEDMAARINEVLSKQEAVLELVAKGKANAEKYDWAGTARETLKIYREAISSKL